MDASANCPSALPYVLSSSRVYESLRLVVQTEPKARLISDRELHLSPPGSSLFEAGFDDFASGFLSNRRYLRYECILGEGELYDLRRDTIRKFSSTIFSVGRMRG